MSTISRQFCKLIASNNSLLRGLKNYHFRFKNITSNLESGAVPSLSLDYGFKLGRVVGWSVGLQAPGSSPGKPGNERVPGCEPYKLLALLVCVQQPLVSYVAERPEVIFKPTGVILKQRQSAKRDFHHKHLNTVKLFCKSPFHTLPAAEGESGRGADRT